MAENDPEEQQKRGCSTNIVANALMPIFLFQLPVRVTLPILRHMSEMNHDHLR